ncbi:MAG TPA: elongation factor P maturation arginine rhamnosyltransferase EarP [Methylophilus sp.]|nr:elongation factor P maturation arginine rhamnosyltransferase EarP [Methylophilus sp.]HQQ33871.1 elongation factor P maturation arginine rhamnosyltransferase EarP [Methylophilus sp.]
MTRRYDVFCKIVDNFGDIGVCWRLARQLQTEHEVDVRLFVDDLQVASRIIPNLDATKILQTIDRVEILRWDAGTKYPGYPDAVVEAFGCELPAAYLADMPAETIWVNLEYLSAEPWVEGFHGQYSNFGVTRHKRYFFYPGFTEKTGGLLREKSLLNRCSESRIPLALQGIVSPNDTREMLHISLFSYPHAPIGDLLLQLSQGSQNCVVYVSASVLFPAVQAFFGLEKLDIGATYILGSLTVAVLPFLSQDDYDALLAFCDLNFVRGEDSWIRAIWAGKPFIWQPYRQEEDAHLVKLDAFVDLFYADFPLKTMVWKAHKYWVAGQGDASILGEYLRYLPEIQSDTARQSVKLASQTDLVSNLVIFIENLRGTRV